jgi:ribosomal protein S18 acetylase RimI-like enzyme
VSAASSIIARMVTYREAEQRDVPALVAIVLRCDATAGWLETVPPAPHEETRLAGHIADPEHWVLIAAEADEPRGFTSVRAGRDPAAGHIANLFVDPPHWGRGIGGALVERAMEAMRARGYTRGELTTEVDNFRSRALYERLGWHDTGERFVHAAYDTEMARYEIRL